MEVFCKAVSSPIRNWQPKLICCENAESLPLVTGAATLALRTQLCYSKRRELV